MTASKTLALTEKLIALSSVTPDDKGWVLTPGRQAYGGDVVVPGHGVVLAEGTLFPAGKVLNYALPIQSVTLAVGTVLPVAASLAAALEVPLDTVLRADVRDSAAACCMRPARWSRASRCCCRKARSWAPVRSCPGRPRWKA